MVICQIGARGDNKEYIYENFAELLCAAEQNNTYTFKDKHISEILSEHSEWKQWTKELIKMNTFVSPVWNKGLELK